jgi:anti-sigma regulatory factor (Ser/Thr protein kinase)
MRVSYDLKLVEHRIREQKEYRMSINRNGYVRTMANRIKMILHDKGNLRQAFRIIKQDYYEGLKRDGVFVSGMLKNMDKLSAVYQKNRRWALTRKFYSWRETSIQQKYNEELAIVDSIRTVL